MPTVASARPIDLKTARLALVGGTGWAPPRLGAIPLDFQEWRGEADRRSPRCHAPAWIAAAAAHCAIAAAILLYAAATTVPEQLPVIAVTLTYEAAPLSGTGAGRRSSGATRTRRTRAGAAKPAAAARARRRSHGRAAADRAGTAEAGGDARAAPASDGAPGDRALAAISPHSGEFASRGAAGAEPARARLGNARPGSDRAGGRATGRSAAAG